MKENIVIIAKDDDNLNMNMIDNKPIVEIERGKISIKKAFMEDAYIEEHTNSKDHIRKAKRTIYDDAID